KKENITRLMTIKVKALVLAKKKLTKLLSQKQLNKKYKIIKTFLKEVIKNNSFSQYTKDKLSPNIFFTKLLEDTKEYKLTTNKKS
ncbi:7865_t:CDS:1, partial [Dentiscutata heterogama]